MESGSLQEILSGSRSRAADRMAFAKAMFRLSNLRNRKIESQRKFIKDQREQAKVRK